MDLPCLDSGRNSNLTSNDMDDLRRQDIAVDGANEPYHENVPYKVPQPEFPQNDKTLIQHIYGFQKLLS